MSVSQRTQHSVNEGAGMRRLSRTEGAQVRTCPALRGPGAIFCSAYSARSQPAMW